MIQITTAAIDGTGTGTGEYKEIADNVFLKDTGEIFISDGTEAIIVKCERPATAK